MNNYTMKKDRVGIDESFPYPIKLEYDDENIYLTVLRIPEYYELKANPFAMHAVDIIRNNPSKHFYGEGVGDDNALCIGESMYLSHLWLCVETLSTSNRHFRSRIYKSGTIRRYVCIGGKKTDGNFYNNITVGTTYSFPIRTKLTSYQLHKLNKKGQVKVIVRGTFRYGGKTFCESGRTGITSNQAEITYYK